jgi:hypothetical protein
MSSTAAAAPADAAATEVKYREATSAETATHLLKDGKYVAPEGNEVATHVVDTTGGRRSPRSSRRGGSRASKRGGSRASKRGGRRSSKRGGKRASRRGGSRASRR